MNIPQYEMAVSGRDAANRGGAHAASGHLRLIMVAM
jgi:hypothetical protein